MPVASSGSVSGELKESREGGEGAGVGAGAESQARANFQQIDRKMFTNC